jgi:hopanoid-associated phosphorylase
MIVVVGLAFEARIARRSGLPVICAGSGRNLATALSDAIRGDCDGLISFGVAGGLHADLPSGTCIVGSAIVAGDERFQTDYALSQRFLTRLPGAMSGVLAGVPEPVSTAASKHALHRDTGALAVDMESHVVARAARKHSVPMTAIRVICDPAARSLPDMAFRSVRPDGSASVMSLLGSIMRQPAHLPAMMRVALDMRSARATLVNCGPILAAGLASLAEAA